MTERTLDILKTEVKRIKEQQNQQGFRTLHHDFLNTTTDRITFTDSPEPPDPQQTEKDRLRVLEQKILDDSITTRELIEYERLNILLGR